MALVLMACRLYRSKGLIIVDIQASRFKQDSLLRFSLSGVKSWCLRVGHNWFIFMFNLGISRFNAFLIGQYQSQAAQLRKTTSRKPFLCLVRNNFPRNVFLNSIVYIHQSSVPDFRSLYLSFTTSTMHTSARSKQIASHRVELSCSPLFHRGSNFFTHDLDGFECTFRRFLRPHKTRRGDSYLWVFSSANM